MAAWGLLTIVVEGSNNLILTLIRGQLTFSITCLVEPPTTLNTTR